MQLFEHLVKLCVFLVVLHSGITALGAAFENFIDVVREPFARFCRDNVNNALNHVIGILARCVTFSLKECFVASFSKCHTAVKMVTSSSLANAHSEVLNGCTRGERCFFRTETEPRTRDKVS